jgi:hypothetical protein
LISCGGLGRKKGEPIVLDQPPPPPAVGQAYFYQHTGPQPFSDGSVDVTGGRIVAVTRQIQEKKPILWAFEEHFEKSEGVQIGFYDEKYRLHRQILRAPGGEIEVLYNSPYDERFLNLKADAEKTITVNQQLINAADGANYGNVNMTVKVHRERDERIISPAGAFLCRHFNARIQLKAHIAGEQTDFAATVNSYWCDLIGWFVKEEQVFDPIVKDGQIIRPPYKTESILVSFEPTNYQYHHPVPEEKKSRKKKQDE